MNLTFTNHRSIKRSQRSGFSLSECMIACMVLAVILPTMVSLYVHCNRVMKLSRHQRLILDELTRNAETALGEERSIPLDTPQELPVSEQLLAAVPTASASAIGTKDDLGIKIVYSVHWTQDQIDRSRSLVIWKAEDKR